MPHVARLIAMPTCYVRVGADKSQSLVFIPWGLFFFYIRLVPLLVRYEGSVKEA